jgi:peptidoglycan/LPS O-acetylase OafA/YrhL
LSGPAIVLLLPLRPLLRLCIGLVFAGAVVRFLMALFGASWAAIFSVTFARMAAIGMGATIAVLARTSAGLSGVKRFAPFIAVAALAGLAMIEIIPHATSHRLGPRLVLVLQCTFFVWLWGALVLRTLTTLPGTILQRVTYTPILRTFGKYSYALYLFHGHMNRLFAKLGFNPDTGVLLAGSVLPWQLLYLAVSSAASLLVAYLSWHLYEKHFLRLKAFFPERKRVVPPPPVPPCSTEKGDIPDNIVAATQASQPTPSIPASERP